MTPESQRIAIAEACGWKPYDGDRSKYHEWVASQSLWTKEGETTPEGWSIHMERDLPDYLDDLNAISEAEDMIYGKYPNGIEIMQHIEYCKTICRRDHQHMMRLSAAQRAEAFLRTKGLWTDDQ